MVKKMHMQQNHYLQKSYDNLHIHGHHYDATRLSIIKIISYAFMIDIITFIFSSSS